MVSRREVSRRLARLEALQSKRFGNDADPLLVSVRSGAKFSMPGMMDTILNLGLNDASGRRAREGLGDRRFALDSYRRFIQMYADVVLEIPKAEFEHLLAAAKKARKVEDDTAARPRRTSRRSIVKYKEKVQKATGKRFPQDSHAQLWGRSPRCSAAGTTTARASTAGSTGSATAWGRPSTCSAWSTGTSGTTAPRASRSRATRRRERTRSSASSSRTPRARTSSRVSGRRGRSRGRNRRPAASDSLEATMPECYAQLLDIRATLETHYKDMQDIEFTIERGTLYMLQTRTGKRTGLAALHIAFDFKEAGVIDTKSLLERVEADMLVQLLAPIFDREGQGAREQGRAHPRKRPTRGPGGRLRRDRLQRRARRRDGGAADDRCSWSATETSPEDLAGMVAGGRHPDEPGRHDLARGGRRARDGQALHRRARSRSRSTRRPGKLTAAGKTLKEGRRGLDRRDDRRGDPGGPRPAPVGDPTGPRRQDA